MSRTTSSKNRNHGRRSAFESLEPRAMLAALAWNAGDGQYGDPFKWDPQETPSTADDITFNRPADVTVTLNGSMYGSTSWTVKQNDVTLLMDGNNFNLQETTLNIATDAGAGLDINNVGESTGGILYTFGGDVDVGTAFNIGTLKVTSATIDLRDGTDPAGNFTANSSFLEFSSATIYTGETKIGRSFDLGTSTAALGGTTSWTVSSSLLVGAGSELTINGGSIIVEDEVTFQGNRILRL